LKLPHAPALPQVALQFTPRLLVSLATVAASVAWVPTMSVAGSDDALEIVTTTGAVARIVAVAVADAVGSVVDVAVIVTVPPGGIEAGPTKFTLAPLAV